MRCKNQANNTNSRLYTRLKNWNIFLLFALTIQINQIVSRSIATLYGPCTHWEKLKVLKTFCWKIIYCRLNSVNRFHHMTLTLTIFQHWYFRKRNIKNNKNMENSLLFILNRRRYHVNNTHQNCMNLVQLSSSVFFMHKKTRYHSRSYICIIKTNCETGA